MKVKTIELNDILKYDQPTKFIVNSDNYDDSFTTPVLTAGKTFILGYTDEKEGVFNNIPAIIFDDFTTSFHYVDFPFKVKSSAMKILTPKSSDVSIKYIYYIMHGLRIDTELHKRYWISIFSKLKIQLPPLKTQIQIANILDDAAALRDKTKQLLEEYDNLAQSIFLEMFGDRSRFEEQELGKIITLLNSKRIPVKASDRVNMQGEYPYYGASGIIDYIDEFLFDETCLLIGEDGANLISRSTPIAFIASGRYWVNNHAHVISKKSNINLIYLMYYINSINLEPYITGSAQPKLNATNLRKIPVPISSKALQNKFTEKIALIEQQKELARQELKESEDLFNCLLQKAFKGELVREAEEV